MQSSRRQAPPRSEPTTTTTHGVPVNQKVKPNTEQSTAYATETTYAPTWKPSTRRLLFLTAICFLPFGGAMFAAGWFGRQDTDGSTSNPSEFTVLPWGEDCDPSNLYLNIVDSEITPSSCAIQCHANTSCGAYTLIYGCASVNSGNLQYRCSLYTECGTRGMTGCQRFDTTYVTAISNYH